MVPVQTDGLSKQFSDVVAVDTVSLTVERGEIFGFLGPNGAGKSTTLNMLLDFIRPTAGSAEVFGRDVQQESTAIRERVGVLPEGYGFEDRLTGREHIEWAIASKKAADDPDEIIETVGLCGDEHRLAAGYSKGMQQRLAFGMALAGDPELLVLDEPSTGLDPNGMQSMRSTIRDRADSGTTVLFSSHILPEVEAICDRIGVMNEGELVAVDTIENLREEAGGHASIDLVCATPPDPADVTTVDGVADATVDGTTLTVRCTDPAVKVDIVRQMDRQADVVNIRSEDASLEELFNIYTGGGRDEDGVAGPAEGR